MYITQNKEEKNPVVFFTIFLRKSKLLRSSIVN